MLCWEARLRFDFSYEASNGVSVKDLQLVESKARRPMKLPRCFALLCLSWMLFHFSYLYLVWGGA